jgi:DNA-binding XRE family transcriptional regulator
MAKTVDDQTKFIELRAKSHSFDKIAQEIGVSKPTLLKWDKELRKQVLELRFLHFESVAWEFALMKKHRVDYLAELYERAKQELENRDLSNVSTEKLLDMVTRLEDRLLSELEGVTFTTSETVEGGFDIDALLNHTTIVTEYKVD